MLNLAAEWGSVADWVTIAFAVIAGGFALLSYHSAGKSEKAAQDAQERANAIQRDANQLRQELNDEIRQYRQLQEDRLTPRLEVKRCYKVGDPFGVKGPPSGRAIELLNPSGVSVKVSRIELVNVSGDVFSSEVRQDWFGKLPRSIEGHSAESIVFHAPVHFVKIVIYAPPLPPIEYIPEPPIT